MDSQTEQLVIQNIRKWMSDRTLIVATHRGQLLELVDRVIVLDNGKIVADDKKEKFIKTDARKNV